MKQIRVAWVPGSHSSREEGVLPSEGGGWMLDTPQNRDDLAVLIDTGNTVCGPRTHWLEQREISMGSLVVGQASERNGVGGSKLH